MLSINSRWLARLRSAYRLGAAGDGTHRFVPFLPAVPLSAGMGNELLLLGAKGALMKSLGILVIRPVMPFLPIIPF